MIPSSIWHYLAATDQTLGLDRATWDSVWHVLDNAKEAERRRIADRGIEVVSTFTPGRTTYRIN